MWVVVLPAKNYSGHVIIGPFEVRDQAYYYAEAAPGDYVIEQLWPKTAFVDLM